jgi:hypothetical protein
VAAHSERQKHGQTSNAASPHAVQCHAANHIICTAKRAKKPGRLRASRC